MFRRILLHLNKLTAKEESNDQGMQYKESNKKTAR